jgi:hypothetical protein
LRYWRSELIDVNGVDETAVVSRSWTARRGETYEIVGDDRETVHKNIWRI